MSGVADLEKLIDNSIEKTIETDAVVIGAGPVGLFQVFELGLLDIRAHVIDALPCAGGQCVELYGDKPIYDIPGIAVCTGRELVDRLTAQIAPFNAPLHLGEQVTSLARRDDGRFDLTTSGGTAFTSKVVVIAAGAGAFLPRKIKLDGLDAFEGRGLRHHIDEGTALAGQRIVVVGGAEPAVDTVLRFAETAASLTLVHRRDQFQATDEALARIAELRASGTVQVIAGQPSGFAEHDGRLASLTVTDNDGVDHILPLDALLVRLGLSPQLGPIAHWELALDRKQLVVDTARFETSVPGIFAVGDINTYPGKRKLILCGFHEATLAAFAAAELVHPGKPVHLQYTTTSPRLHQLLGVSKPPRA